MQKDENSVIFLNLHCGLSVDPSIKFGQGEFVFDTAPTSIKHVDNNQEYFLINGLVIYCDDPAVSKLDASKMEHINAVSAHLRRSYIVAEEIITTICGKFLTFAYFDKPVSCAFRGKEYELDDMTFSDKSIRTHRFHKAITNDLSFLNANKNPRRLFHFYRLANDVTVAVDQRILMAWRFLECYCGKKDTNLVNYLSSTQFVDGDGNAVKFRRSTINDYYRYYRSAVAHASRPTNPNHAKKIIYPRAEETTFSLPLHRRLFGVLDAIDTVLVTNKRVY